MKFVDVLCTSGGYTSLEWTAVSAGPCSAIWSQINIFCSLNKHHLGSVSDRIYNHFVVGLSRALSTHPVGNLQLYSGLIVVVVVSKTKTWTASAPACQLAASLSVSSPVVKTHTGRKIKGSVNWSILKFHSYINCHFTLLVTEVLSFLKLLKHRAHRYLSTHSWILVQLHFGTQTFKIIL